jgi:hypothetical protein
LTTFDFHSILEERISDRDWQKQLVVFLLSLGNDIGLGSKTIPESVLQ